MDRGVAPRINEQILARIYYMSKTVKSLAIIDILFSFFYLSYSPYIGFLNLLNLILAYFGYFGAKNFDKNFTLGYLIYNSVKFVSSVVFPIIIFCIVSVPAGIIVMSVFLMLLNLYVLLFVSKFYNELNGLTKDDVNYLRLMNYVGIGLILW